MGNIHKSVIEQLQDISKILEELEFYEWDCFGIDVLSDSIFYSKIKDEINEKIKEINSRSETS